METFKNKPLADIAARVKVEMFCGSRCLRVDGRKIGDSMAESRAEEIRCYLVTALPDLEALFTEPSASVTTQDLSL